MIGNNTILGRSFFGRVGSVCALCAFAGFPALGQEVPASDDQPVQVSDFGTVTLAVQDTDLAQVLEMLSIQSKKNIITSKNVSATISANLYDVTFYEALDAILTVNGYGYMEKGNFIYIYTQDEMEAIENANRRTESRSYELEYLSAGDAHEFIAPLLSPDGRSSFRGDVAPGIDPDKDDVGGESYAYSSRVVVNDYAENLDGIEALLNELDVAPKQLFLEATVLQTTLDESNAFGVDFSLIGDVDFIDLTAPLAGVNNLLAGDDATNGFQPEDNEAYIGTSSPGNATGPGTLKVGVVKDDLAVFLRVLDEVTDSKVLARPKVMCLNRQRAEVLVGARVGYLSTTATQTTTTQTVEFLDTGIQLLFRPFISPNGMIRLELAPSVSEASLRTVTDSQGLQVTIPDELTNEVTTNVRVQDGQTLVLGGLFRESIRTNRRQVPLLGDVPIAGNLFRGQDDNVDRSEIIFMITPTIIHDDLLWDKGREAMEYANAVQVGAREGLLDFSRSKQADNYNLRAIEAYNRGDLDRALYHVNNSLRIYPQQPTVITLREKITGAPEKAYERSMMEHILRENVSDITAGMPNSTRMTDGKPVAFFDRTLGQSQKSNPTQQATNDGVEETPATSDQLSTGANDPNVDQFTAGSEPLPADAQFVDRFLHEYFTALGLAYLSPVQSDEDFRAVSGTETGEEDEAFPFTTFDDMVGSGSVQANTEDQ